MQKCVGLLLVSLLISVTTQGQLLTKEQLKKEKAFVSLTEALKNPDKVVKLELWSADLQAVPLEIFKFKNLQVLNLNFNQIKSLPRAFVRLKYLQELRLGHNQLSHVPTILEKLAHLRILDLHGNQLKSIPDNIGQLTQLEELYLHENQLKEVHSSWQALTRLRFVNLSENKLQSLPVSKNHQLKQLKMLIVVENPIADKAKNTISTILKDVEIRF
ncbi:MAG TPA: hypothetical protein DCS93_38860 [Microscillaceae bacterium]|nr:hypothetical protein [Microscillaceae bacterium]